MEYDKSKYLGKRIILNEGSLAEIENVDDLGFTIRIIAGGPSSSLKADERYFYSHTQLNFRFAEQGGKIV